jgi:RNA polymerase sigma-70 factor (ECF subfamily)
VLRRADAEGRVRLPIAPDLPDGGSAEANRDTEAVWREFHGRVRSFVSRRVANDADADDIVQKMFLQVHRKASGVRDRDRLAAWLFQIARNAIVDHYRSPLRKREVASGGVVEMASLPHATVAGEADDAGGHEEVAGCIRPMIDRLPAIYRRALTLVELDGRSQVAAAATEGISVSGMKARVQRGRAQLKEMLVSCCESALAACTQPGGCEAALSRPRAADPAPRAPCATGRRG